MFAAGSTIGSPGTGAVARVRGEGDRQLGQEPVEVEALRGGLEGAGLGGPRVGLVVVGIGLGAEHRLGAVVVGVELGRG